MKLIESSVEFLSQEPGIEGLYRHIERCARVAYKSEDKITDESSKSFVDRMIKSHHGAVLEHGTLYIKYPYNWHVEDREPKPIIDVRSWVKQFDTGHAEYLTTNYRDLIENGTESDIDFFCNPTEFHEKRYTMKFVCSRAIAQELTRHRVFSHTMESQRYCGYDKSKFGGELTFIMPQWYKEAKYDSTKLNEFDKHLKQTEDLYMFYRDCEMQAQEARDILPNCTKTELCMTGFASDWRHLLDLRLFERTGIVHPDMKLLMQKLEKVMKDSNIWDDVMNYKSSFE